MQTRMKITVRSLLLWMIALMVMALSCEKPPTITKDQVIEERLNERLQNWREGKYRQCRNKVLERAATIVDSTLLANAHSQRDTTGLPPIPQRPEKPEFKPPADSTPIKKILESNSTPDTTRQ